MRAALPAAVPLLPESHHIADGGAEGQGWRGAGCGARIPGKHPSSPFSLITAIRSPACRA